MQDRLTALMIASDNGYRHIVKALIEAKADVDLQNKASYVGVALSLYLLRVEFDLR